MEVFILIIYIIAVLASLGVVLWLVISEGDWTGIRDRSAEGAVRSMARERTG
jgi:hypothetical protein